MFYHNFVVFSINSVKCWCLNIEYFLFKKTICLWMYLWSSHAYSLTVKAFRWALIAWRLLKPIGSASLHDNSSRVSLTRNLNLFNDVHFRINLPGCTTWIISVWIDKWNRVVRKRVLNTDIIELLPLSVSSSRTFYQNHTLRTQNKWIQCSIVLGKALTGIPEAVY